MTRSRPVSCAQLALPAVSYILHDVVDGPWLVDIPWRPAWRNALVVLDTDPLLHPVDARPVIAVGVVLWVMIPHPFRKLRGALPWVNLDLIPIRVLKQLCVGKAHLLGTGCANEAEADMSLDSFGYVVRIPTFCET